MKSIIPTLLVLLSVVFSQFTKDSVPGVCTKALDCSLLGDCIDGRCVCDPGFTGSNCHVFDLIPSKIKDIEGNNDPDHPTWGGKTMYADGKWHFISSYIRNRCDIHNYNTNSAWQRCVGDHPQGPFTYVEEIAPPFHHGAQVERALDGGYHVFGDGRDMPESTVLGNCAVVGPGRGLASSKTEERATPAIIPEEEEARRRLAGGLYPYGNSPNDVHVVISAPKITGPWTSFEIKELKTNTKNIYAWNCNKTNLAPLIMKNGTVIMGYRAKACVEPSVLKCGKACQFIGIAVSHTGVRGPYTLRRDPIEPLVANEDPFMWQNKRGFFLVNHGKTQCGNSQADTNTCGTLAYSLDTYTWYLSPEPVYTGIVKFDPSTGLDKETLKLRHRPKITFNNEGVPLVLYNAGQRFRNPYVRSFAFAFNVPEMRDYEAPPPCPPVIMQNICTEFTRNGHKYQRTKNGCTMMGAGNCMWCPNDDGETGRCMPGSDARICKAATIESFYAHC